MSVVPMRQQAQLKPKGPSFGEALAKTTKAEPKPKKATMPTIQPPPEVAQAVEPGGGEQLDV